MMTFREQVSSLQYRVPKCCCGGAVLGGVLSNVGGRTNSGTELGPLKLLVHIGSI